jgi:hemolysin activation/secretion protein
MVPTPPAAGEAGPLVRINEFRIEGNQLLSSDVLQRALAGFSGRDLSLTQLQEAAWVIVRTYRAAGWLVHAFVPPQEIDRGIVNLKVIEAKLGQLRIDFPKDAHLPHRRIQSMADAQLLPGQPLSLHQVDRLVLLLSDMSGVVGSASYLEGEQPGTTDVMLRLAEGKKIEARLMLDNFGSVSTGSERLSANLAVNNAMGLGDALAIQAVRTQGSTYARAAYSQPVGLQGWRAGFHASDLSYNLVGSFATLQASGTAQTWGADLSVPLLRSTVRNVSLQISTDRKTFDNQTEATSVSKYRVDLLRSGLNANWFDQWLTPSQNSASVMLTSGSVDLTGSPSAAGDSNAARTAGHFQKINLGYNREQSLTSQLSTYLQAGAQLANRNLDSSEKLYLGGASGVRAYPSNEAGGSTGYTLTVGLKHRLDSAWTLNGFADMGRIQVYRNNVTALGAPITALNTLPLQGVGLSVSWQGGQGKELSATWSHRQGANPSATTAGADSDGTRTLNRLWLSAALNF